MNVDIIRSLAKEQGLSIKKLEEVLGFGNGTIGKWDKQSPSCDKLLSVANYLSVSVDYLLTGESTFSTNNSLTNIQQRALNALDRLVYEDKIAFIAKMEQRADDYPPEIKESAS